MKNLKKVLALVVVLTMVLGTVAFASFTDVTEDNDAYTAVQTLSSLEILNGYDDGSFKPEGNITRAEFCAVVCRALGLESQANGSKGTTIFSDVPADHWASGYINLAAGQKIVNGMGDGTFAPESNVTYEQAVKMLVVALGYEPMAASKGGWPAGYLVVANQYGMTKNVKGVAQDGAATRGTVAQLVYNALPIAVMEQTGFGTQTTYTIMDGSGDYDYKSLLTGLDIAKIEGRVVGTSVIAYDNSTCETDEVVYSFNEVNDDTDWEDYLNKNADKEGYADYTFKVTEGVNADDYFGISSIIYAKKLSSNKYTIVAIMPGEDSQVVSLGLNDLDADTDYSATAKKIVYYPTAGSSKTSSYSLSDNAKFYYNYESKTGAQFLDIIKDSDGIKDDNGMEITLIENTGDSKYDMVIVKEYTYAVIDTVEADKDRFTVKDGTTYKFDFDDETISNKLTNKDGEAITLEDFAEDDVVGILTKDNNHKDFDWCDIINLGANSVTGTVNGLNTADETIKIDNVSYDVVGATMPKNGDEGTFYLTKTGKVFDFDLDSSVSGNYAYILQAKKVQSGFDNAWQVKLLTKENGVVDYKLKDDFKINNNSYKNDADTIAELADMDDVNDFKNNASDRIITFKLDSKNEVKEIKTGDAAAKNFTVEEIVAGTEYKKDTQSLKRELEDDTVIFDIDASSATSTSSAKVSYLVDEAEYAGYIVKNADDEYDCVVLTSSASKIDVTQDIAVVTGITTSETNETDSWTIDYVVGDSDETQTIVVYDDADLTSIEWGTDMDSVAKGTLFMFTDAGDGTASAFAAIAYANNSLKNDDAVYTVNKTATAEICAKDTDNDFVFGYIVDYKSKNGGKNVSYTTLDGKDETINIKSTTNSFVYYNRNKNSVSIETGTWDAGDVDKFDATENEGTFFILRTYNGAAQDFITYSTRKDVSKITKSSVGLSSVKTSTPAKADVVEDVVEEVKEPTADSDIAVDVE